MERSRKEYLSRALDTAEKSRACRVASSLAKETNLSADYLWRRSHESRVLALAKPGLLLGKIAASNTAKLFEKLESRQLRNELLAGIVERFGGTNEQRRMAHIGSQAFGELWVDVWRDEGKDNATVHWDEVLSAEKIYGHDTETAIAIGEMVDHCVDISNSRCLKREILQWYWVDTREPSSLVRKQQGVSYIAPAKPALLEMLSVELQHGGELEL